MKTPRFGVLLTLCMAFCASTVSAQNNDTSREDLMKPHLKVYGTADIGVLGDMVHRRFSAVGGGHKPSFLGFSPSVRATDWLAADAFVEAGFNLTTGDGNGGLTTLDNTAATSGPICSLKGTDAGSSCSVRNGAAQGLLFAREARLRLMFGRSRELDAQYGAGATHQLSLGRNYSILADQDARYSIGITGVGNVLTLASAQQGPTFLRLSNSVNYSSPLFLGGFAVQAQYAFGTQGLWRNGNVAAGRISYAHAGTGAGMAIQYTKLLAGDVLVLNAGFSQVIGLVRLAMLGQHTRVDSDKPFSATFVHAHVATHITANDALQLGYGWLEVHHSLDDGGQATFVYTHKAGRFLELYVRASHMLNQGKAAYVPAPGLEILPGHIALAIVSGAAMEF